MQVTTISVLLDGVDVTTGSSVSAAGFSYSPPAQLLPPAPLAYPAHLLEVTIFDIAGASAYASTTVTIPAPAPVVSYLNETATAVFAGGLLPANINMAALNVAITSSSSGNPNDVLGVGKLVGNSFQVVFTTSAGVTDFSATLAYVDVAGDIGPATPVTIPQTSGNNNLNFGNNGSYGDSSALSPTPPSLSLDIYAGLPGTDTATVTVGQMWIGQIDSLTVSVGAQTVSVPGANGSTGGGTFTACPIPVPEEGGAPVSAMVTVRNTANGLSAGGTTPAIALTTPLSWVTANTACLYLNGNTDDTLSGAIRAGTGGNLPRCVYAAAVFGLSGNICDASGISGNQVNVTINGQTLTGTQVNISNSYSLSSPSSQQPNLYPLNTGSLASTLTDGSYELLLTCTDLAGNTTKVDIFLYVQLESPGQSKLNGLADVNGGLIGNNGAITITWDDDGATATNAPTVGGVYTTSDILRVYDSDGTTALNRGYFNGAWMYAPANFQYTPSESAITVTLEDLAGNQGQASYTLTGTLTPDYEGSYNESCSNSAVVWCCLEDSLLQGVVGNYFCNAQASLNISSPNDPQSASSGGGTCDATIWTGVAGTWEIADGVAEEDPSYYPISLSKPLVTSPTGTLESVLIDGNGSVEVTPSWDNSQRSHTLGTSITAPDMSVYYSIEPYTQQPLPIPSAILPFLAFRPKMCRIQGKMFCIQGKLLLVRALRAQTSMGPLSICCSIRSLVAR